MVAITRAATLVVIAAAWFARPDPALAQDAALARALFDEGVAHSDAHRWASAAEAFARSSAIIERPSTVFNHALALYEAGRIAGARVRFTRFLEIATPSANERGTAVERLAEVDGRLRTMLARIVATRLRPSVALAVRAETPILGQPRATPREPALSALAEGRAQRPADGPSLFEDWPFWTVVGIVVALAVPVAVVVSTSGPLPIDSGSTGIILMP